MILLTLSKKEKEIRFCSSGGIGLASCAGCFLISLCGQNTERHKEKCACGEEEKGERMGSREREKSSLLFSQLHRAAFALVQRNDASLVG
jgi:hypothetical protein